MGGSGFDNFDAGFGTIHTPDFKPSKKFKEV